MKTSLGPLAVVAAVVVACTSSGTPGSSSGGTSPCSTGPAYTWESNFTYSGDNEGYRTCTPRCAYTKPIFPNLTYPPEAMPSGACLYEGESCNMTVQVFCCNGPSGPRHVMRCRCEGGQWVCTYASQGAGTCGGCIYLDAGADSGSDASPPP